MTHFIRILLWSWLIFGCNKLFSQKVDFGLISQLELTNFKKLGHFKSDDILMHNSIDSLTKTKTYLSKLLVGEHEKLHISIHTNLSIEQFLKPIKTNKLKSMKVSFWLYKKVHFVSLEFLKGNKKINRIIYQEPNLTTIIILDYLTDFPNNNTIYKQIIKGLTFRTST